MYWIGWDRWRWHLQKRSLLEQVTQLQLGKPMSVDWRPTIEGAPPPFLISGKAYSERGIYFRHVACRWPDELYVVLVRYENSRSVSIEVFALPSAPKDYAAKTLRGQLDARRRAEWLDDKFRAAALASRGIPDLAEPEGRDSPEQIGYWSDFIELVTGDAEEELGFEYKRVYELSSGDSSD
jgi:hypothetical protein